MVSITGQIRGAKPRRPHAASPSLLRGPMRNAGFGEVAAEFQVARSARDKAVTVGTLMCHVKVWGRWLDGQGLGLRDVREKHLDAYVNHRRDVDGVGEICRRHDVIYIKALHKFAKKRGYLRTDPLAEYELPIPSKVHRKSPSPQNLHDILGAVERLKAADSNNCLRHRGDEGSSRFYTARDQAIIALGITTGARIGEILAWTPDNYDRANHQLVIPISKTNTYRYVAIEPAAVPFVERWFTQRPSDEVIRASEWFQAQVEAGNNPQPTLFVAEGGQPLKQNCWGRTFKKYCAAAGVDGITFHCIRHFNITEVAGVSLKAAMEQAGHESPVTTKAYLHSNAERQRAALLQASPLGQVLAVATPKRKQSLIRK